MCRLLSDPWWLPHRNWWLRRDAVSQLLTAHPAACGCQATAMPALLFSGVVARQDGGAPWLLAVPTCRTLGDDPGYRGGNGHPGPCGARTHPRPPQPRRPPSTPPHTHRQSSGPKRTDSLHTDPDSFAGGSPAGRMAGFRAERGRLASGHHPHHRPRRARPHSDVPNMARGTLAVPLPTGDDLPRPLVQAGLRPSRPRWQWAGTGAESGRDRCHLVVIGRRRHRNLIDWHLHVSVPAVRRSAWPLGHGLTIRPNLADRGLAEPSANGPTGRRCLRGLRLSSSGRVIQPTPRIHHRAGSVRVVGPRCKPRREGGPLGWSMTLRPIPGARRASGHALC